MLLNVLPKDIGEKLRPKRQKYPTFQTILQYCRERLEEQRELHKAVILNSSKRADKVHAATEPAELPQPPMQHAAIAPPITDQLASANSQLTSPITAVEQLSQMILSMGQNTATQRPAKGGIKGDGRRPQGEGKGNLYKKLIFGGCWEYGDRKHSRWECAKWK